MMEGVNMVNAPVAARERGIDVAETVHDRPSEYQTLVRITVETDKLTRSVSGTLFAGWRPRWSRSRASRWRRISRRTCCTSPTRTSPASSAVSARRWPDAGINIATFHLGRAEPGGDAICLVSVDERVPEDVLRRWCATLPLVMQATALEF